MVMRISAHTALGLGTGNGQRVKLQDSKFETGDQSKGFEVQLMREEAKQSRHKTKRLRREIGTGTGTCLFVDR